MKFYVCNGKRPECEGKKSVCRTKGGCFYTTDIFCALYDTHEEFEPVYHKNEPPDYFEVIRQKICYARKQYKKEKRIK